MKAAALLTLVLLISACGSDDNAAAPSSSPSDTASSSSDTTADSITPPTASAPVSEASDPDQIVTVDLVLKVAADEKVDADALAHAAASLGERATAATVTVVGDKIHVTVPDVQAGSVEDVLVRFGNGRVFIRPVLACGVIATDATTATSMAPISDPTMAQVLPTRDGTKCQVGPASATGQVFTGEATAEQVDGNWLIVAPMRPGADGEDAFNAIAAMCYEGTNECPSHQLAIEIDGEIVTAPSVQAPSFVGSLQISGSFTEPEADTLALLLNRGALPVVLEVESFTVTATG